MSGDEQHEFTVTGSTVRYEGAIVALRVDEVVMPVATRPGAKSSSIVGPWPSSPSTTRIVSHSSSSTGNHSVGACGIAGRSPRRGGREPVDAAERELAEEVDLAADRWEVLLDLALSPGFTDEALRVYLARGLVQPARCAARRRGGRSALVLGAVGHRGRDGTVR